MTNPYQFLEVPSVETTRFDRWLFHEPAHLNLQSPDGWRTYVITKKEETLGIVHFHVHEGVARASVKSPFGTIQFADDLPPEILFSFIQFVEEQLKNTGVHTILLKNPPALYAPFQNELLSVSLINLGYQVSNAEAGAVLQVGSTFESALDEWEVRKLKQAEDHGLIFSTADPGRLEDVYNFIFACREERGQSLSLSYDELMKVVAVFPDRFSLHQVTDNDQLAAAAIVIKINNQILYNFYSAHASVYDALSPVVLLMKGLYGFCSANEIQLLDLGTSALDGKPNFGLLDFKIRLGARPSAKFTFQKKLP